MVTRDLQKRTPLCLEKARDILASYQEGRSPVKPPIRIESVAEWMGFQVILLNSVGEEFSGLVSMKQKLIGVNGRHHRHRRRFTIGHELAHILLKHPPESHCTAKEITLYNSEADECAGELLMPASLLTQWPLMTKNLRDLAYAFDVSEEAMAVKMKQVGSR